MELSIENRTCVLVSVYGLQDDKNVGDHILAMPGVHATACFALNTPDSAAWNYSDHCTVIADLNL